MKPGDEVIKQLLDDKAAKSLSDNKESPRPHSLSEARELLYKAIDSFLKDYDVAWSPYRVIKASGIARAKKLRLALAKLHSVEALIAEVGKDEYQQGDDLIHRLVDAVLKFCNIKDDEVRANKPLACQQLITSSSVSTRHCIAAYTEPEPVAIERRAKLIVFGHCLKKAKFELPSIQPAGSMELNPLSPSTSLNS